MLTWLMIVVIAVTSIIDAFCIYNIFGKGPKDTMAAEEISEGDTVEADLDNGIIRNITTGKEYKTAPFPDFVQKIIENGGLMQAIVNEAF